MFIKSVKLRHYCQHEKLDVEFRPGLNGILGRNGHGKSNLMDAIRFLVTGQSINPGNRADNVTWGHDKGTVSGELVIGDTTYHLTRSIESAKATLKFEGHDAINRSSEIEDFLVGLLGTPYRALLDNVFIPQGKIDSILFARPGERLKEFQQTFGLDKAAEAHRWLSQEVNAYPVTAGLAEQLESATTAALEARDQLAALQADVALKRKLITDLEPYEAVVKRAFEASRTAEAIRLADQQVERADAEVSRCADVELKVTKEYDELKAGVDSLKAVNDASVLELTQLEQNLALYTRAAGVRTKLEAAHVQLAVCRPPSPGSIERVQAELDDIKQQMGHIDTMLGGQRPMLPQEQTTVAALHAAGIALAGVPERREATQAEGLLTHEIRTIEEHIELARQGKCPTCGSTFKHDLKTLEAQKAAKQREHQEMKFRLDNEHQTKRLALATTEQGLRQQLAELRASAETVLKADRTRLLDARTTARANLELFTRLQTEHDQALRAVELLDAQLLGAPATEPDRTRIASLRHVTLQFAAFERQLLDLGMKLQVVKQQTTSAVTAMQNARAMREQLGQGVDMPSPEQIEEAKRQIETLQLTRTALNELGHQIGVATALAEQRQQTAERLRVQLAGEAVSAAWVDEVRKVRDALHVGALPALMMREYAKVINARIAHYLAVWESDFRLWLTDDMDFRVRFDDGKEFEAGRLSGGQKIFAAASFRLAMSDTFARQCGVLVFDEPSVYLDKDNIQHLHQLLLRLKEDSQHSGRQILIVTHEEGLMNFLDHVVEIP